MSRTSGASTALSPLPIGVYTVLFELPGFQNVRREGVRLTVGFTARVDSEMNVGAVSETITVSGASPLVDTTSTATSTELTQEQLEVLPTSRDGFHAFLNQVPGVRTNLDVGSSGLGDTVVFRAYGQDGSPWQMLEGVLASAPTATGAQGSHVDFNAIDGTRVQTVGSNAEMPRRGLLVDSVIKSGGNDFHGTAVAYGSGRKLEGNNIDDDPRGGGHQTGRRCTRCRTSPATWAAASSGTSSGFSAAPGIRTSRETSWTRSIPTARRSRMSRRAPYHFEKVSYQASAGNRFTGFYHLNNDYRAAGREQVHPTRIDARQGQPGLDDEGGMAGRARQFAGHLGAGRAMGLTTAPMTGSAPGKQSTTDIATLYRDRQPVHPGRQPQRAASGPGPEPHQGRRQLVQAGSARRQSRIQGGGRSPVDAGSTTGIVVPSSRCRLTSCGSTTACPSSSPRRTRRLEGPNHGNYLGVYGQDSWTLARRLTLNLGIRVEHDSRVCAAAMPRGLHPLPRPSAWTRFGW